jgi:hypothetical protein
MKASEQTLKTSPKFKVRITLFWRMFLSLLLTILITSVLSIVVERWLAEKELTSFTAPTVHPIGTIDYPTPAKRPAYSVLDDSLLRNVLPNAVGDWGHALPYVIERISSQK